MSEIVEEVSPADEAEDILSRAVAKVGGTRRESQVTLARQMAEAMADGGTVVAEGPTGVGKSLAYLAAALATGGRVVVATHTKALQDQLAKDCEFLAGALGFRYAVLKGMSAYACLSKLNAPEEESAHPALFGDDSEGEEAPRATSGIPAIAQWVHEDGCDGDRKNAPKHTSEEWAKVSTSPDKCAGKACQFADECFAVRARNNAREADIIVVSQAWLAIAMQNPFIAPTGVTAVIVDEAHEFESVLSSSFGAEVTYGRVSGVYKLCKTFLSEAQEEKMAGGIKKAWRALETMVGVPQGKYDTIPLGGDNTRLALEDLEGVLTPLHKAIKSAPDGDEKQRARKDMAKTALQNLIADFTTLKKGKTDTQAAWCEKSTARGDGSIVLKSALFDVSRVCKEMLLNAYDAVVFTSATIRVGGSFEAIRESLGLDNPVEVVVDSPFDFANAGYIWKVAGVCPASPKYGSTQRERAAHDARYARECAEKFAVPAEAAGGRSMMLCTSWAAVNEVADALEEFLPGGYSVLRQAPGEPPARLIEQFSGADGEKMVLVGTRSFWTGVSLPGRQLSVVGVMKLPFSAPTDPVTSAKSDAAGREAFQKVSLPEMLRTLQQGAGRLIRSVDDRGVLCVFDDRSWSKSYSRNVYNALPPMQVVADERVVGAFLAAHCGPVE